MVYVSQFILFLIFLSSPSFIIGGLVSTVAIINVFLSNKLKQYKFDGLTGIRNRRSMEEDLKKVRKNYSGETSLILIDVDHFKSINDSYGHNVGDIVLRAVAHNISKSIRPNDIVCRWGGEEFLILVNGDRHAARDMAERIRLSVENLPITTGKVTVSAGISMLNKEENFSLAVGCADKALYEAKRNGRNKVLVYM